MQGATRTLLGLLVSATLWVPAASATGLDCRSRWLSPTEATVCADTQLARMDYRVARRLGAFAGRLSLGQYLGLRHWHATTTRRRNLCRADRRCIAASYRAQARFLDRLETCLDGSLWRRTCLRDLLTTERETMRR